MLIRRMRAYKAILSFLFLAVIGCSVAQEGYQYPKPSIGFGDAYKNAGVQKPAVTSQTVKPAGSNGQYQQSHTAFQGLTSSVSPKPVIAPVKQQTSFAGLQGSGQSTAQKPVIVPGQYKVPVVDTLKLQTGFGVPQGLGQSNIQKPTAKPQTSFGGFGQQQAVSAGQYQKPVVSQKKPDLSYLPPKTQTSTLTVNKPQVAFQGFTSSAATPRPVVATIKPQASFSGFQSLSQTTVQKPSFSGFSNTQSIAPKPTVRSQNGISGFQGFSQSTVQKPAVGTGQYQKPATITAAKPQVAFQGFTNSAATPKPVFATAKPQTTYGQTVVQKPAVTTTIFSQFGQVPTQQIAGAGQYQKPIVSQQKPAQQKPLVSQQKPVLSYLPPQSQTTTLTANKPQVSFQGFTSSAATPKPVVATAKPQTGFTGFQGFSQSTVQKPAVVTGQYQKPATITAAKPQVAFQGFTSSAATPKPVVATSRPQTSFSGFQGFSQSTVQKPAVVTGQYQKPATITVAKPQVAFQGFTSSTKPQTGFTGFQGFSQSTVQKPAVVTGQYQKPATLTVAKPQVAFQGFTSSAATPKPVVATVRPQTGFSGFQGSSQSTVQKPAVVTGQYQKPATITVAKPQVAFQGFTNSAATKPVIATTGFGQAVVQKPAVTTTILSQFGQAPIQQIAGAGQYQKPIVSQQKPAQQKPLVSQQKPVLSYLPPQSQTTTLTANKPQVTFQGFASSAATPRPVVATAKPQTGFTGFQGFSQSTVQKPAVVTGQYQKPATITAAKPQVAFQGFTSSAATPKPVVATSRPQTSFSGFQGFSQSTVQKPAVVTGQYQKPATITAAKPQVAFQGFTSSTKPQTGFTGFQGFSQSTAQKPAVVTGQYQKPATNTLAKPTVAFQGFTNSAATPKPVVATVRPQAGFSGFQGFSQSTAQKPAVVTGQYQKPATITVAKPQVAFQGFTNSAATPKPVFATAKPQTNFGQTVVQKPAVTTTIFSQFGQVPTQQIAGAGQYQKPIVSQQKPAQQKPLVSQQKPVLSYLPPQSQTTSLTANKPQVTFQGFTSSAATPKPVVATSRPQTSFSGFQGFSQSTVQKPAVVTGQYQKPATITAAKPQVAFQGFTSSAATPKPVVATSRPQTSFSGFQGFSQSTVQKPAVVTGQYQKPATITAAKPQAAFQGFTSSTKPQTGFTGFQGFSQSTVQKPAVVTGQYQKPATITAAKPQVAFQGFTSSAATPKPVVATAKPQTGFSGFQGFSQSTVQKPAVVTGQYQKPATITVAKPQATFQGFTNSAGSKPQTGFSGFQSLTQSTVQKPAVTTTTTKFSQPKVSSQNVNLEYLPPVGAAVPKNIVKSSGAPSQSFFELSSTTANQVVDAAHEQKVAGFVADENIEPAKAYTSLRSGLPSVPQTILSAAQEQKVEKHSSLIDPHFDYQTGPQSSISQIETNEITGNLDQLDINDQYGEFHSQTLPAVSSQQVVNHQFGGLQSQTSQAVPAQQIVKTQLTVLDRGQTSVQGSYQVVEPTGRSLNQPEFSSSNFDHSEYSTPVDIQDETQNLEYYPNNSELSAEQSSSSSNRYHVVRPQVKQDSPVQNPQPLNRDEQQVRRLQEKADSDYEKHVASTLRPGSHIGQHVNKDSDKEYNVFDYDQYSTDPDETEI